jgi:hypothetical protein
MRYLPCSLNPRNPIRLIVVEVTGEPPIPSSMIKPWNDPNFVQKNEGG